MVVDNRHSIETPEGVEFAIDLAGPVPRILAALLDLAIRGGIYFVLAIPLSMLGEGGIGLLLICLFALDWIYPIYFEMFRGGATPGKMVFGLQVLHADGTPVSWRGSVLRNVLRVADLLPMAYAAGIVSMAASRKFQRLGDLAADTVVVYRRPAILWDERSLPQAEPVTVATPLALEEQGAIVDFAERSTRLSPERNEELAAILAPLTGTQDGKKGLQFLRGLANRIVRWA